MIKSLYPKNDKGVEKMNNDELQARIEYLYQVGALPEMYYR
jgi:hypothetical protein